MLKRTLPILFLLLSHTLFAQRTIQGTVKNAETGLALGYTNIQVADTYQGTITNRDGHFMLRLKSLPATLVVRYIGYENENVEITANSPEQISIHLMPTPVQAPTIVVTSDDPAVGIMAQVIKNKQQWRSALKSYKASAYTRAALENDTSIVSISESTSDLFWHHEKGSRELVRSKRETSNIGSDDNFAFAGVLPNLYDDDIEIMGFSMIGPTHPDALKHYHVKMTGERRLGDKTVIDIDIRPKNKLQPTFVGRVSVLYEDAAMIDVDVKPNQAMLFPTPIKEMNVHFKQQYADFGGNFWLPVDVRIDGDIAIGMTGLSFPKIKYNQVSRLSDYAVNIPLPDSLYAGRKAFRVDSLASKQDTLLAAAADRIPLTARESEAYATLDSTMTLAKAFRPRGALARFVDVDAENDGGNGGQASATFGIASGLGPTLLYNRVDGFRGGAGWDRRFFKRWRVRGHAAYSFGLKRGSGGAGTDLRLSRWLTMKADWKNESAVWTPSWNTPLAINSADFLIRGQDHFNWLWRRGWNTELAFRIRKLRSRVSLIAADWQHEAMEKSTDWSIFHRDDVKRDNPAPETARLRTVTAKLTVGGDFVPWGTVGNNRFELSVERSDPAFWHSDANYTRFEAFWEGRIPTLLRRRFLPMALDFRITAGTHTGTLPAERLFTMDGRMGGFTPFGTFRTLRNGRVMGDQYLGVFWEHHFRTVPFELLGLRSLAQRGLGILLHGASGRTWLNSDRRAQMPQNFVYWDQWQHELGLSVTGLFDFLRIDVTQRLGGGGLYAGFSVARLF